MGQTLVHKKILMDMKDLQNHTCMSQSCQKRKQAHAEWKDSKHQQQPLTLPLQPITRHQALQTGLQTDGAAAANRARM